MGLMARKAPKWSTVETLPRHPDVDAFIERYKGPIRAHMEAIRELVHAASPDVREAIYWGVPFYWRHGPMMYASPAQKHVTVGFTRGREIKDGSGRLEGSEKTPVAKTQFRRGDVLPLDDLNDWIAQALALDEQYQDEVC